MYDDKPCYDICVVLTPPPSLPIVVLAKTINGKVDTKLKPMYDPPRWSMQIDQSGALL